MVKAFDRNIADAGERIVLLAPSVSAVSEVFQNVDVNPIRHRELLAEVQALRGRVYLQDGAIQEHQLSNGGLHKTAEDDKSWHVLLMNRDQQVDACLLYLEHQADVRFEDTRAAMIPLTQDRQWRQSLWRAVDGELTRARRDRLKFVELGGWAASEKCRGTAGPLAIVLAVWGFSRRCGGALGMTTATFRHCSATILKRLGGSRFEMDDATLPPYFDARYGCMMELLRFDSRQPNPKYLGLIDRVRDNLGDIRVIARPSPIDLISAPARALAMGATAARYVALAS
jgi:hypothetical protein